MIKTVRKERGGCGENQEEDGGGRERERTKVLMGHKAHTLKDAVFVVDGDGVGDDGNGGGEGSHVLEPLESGLKAHPLGLVQRQPQLSQHGSHPPPGCRCSSEKRDCKGSGRADGKAGRLGVLGRVLETKSMANESGRTSRQQHGRLRSQN